MLNNFIYAQTKDLFLEALGAGNILDEAIVFIEDTKEIWNHGTYFAGESIDPDTLSEIQTSVAQLTANKADKATTLSGYGITDGVEKEIVGSLVTADVQAICGGDFVYALPDQSNGDEDDVLLSQGSVKTINGESIYGSGDISVSRYAECNSAAASNLKVITLDNFSYKDGSKVVVKFVNGVTAITALAVNGSTTGVLYRCAGVSVINLPVNSIVEFTYANSAWNITSGYQASGNYYGTCSTAAGTVAKTVNVGSSFVLTNGAEVTITFTYGNTVTNPTLNVNSTGAKSLLTGGYVSSRFMADTIITVVYNGAEWVMKGSSAAITVGNENGYTLQAVNSSTCGLGISVNASITSNLDGDLYIHHGGTNSNAIYCRGGNIVANGGHFDGAYAHNTRIITGTATLNAYDSLVLYNTTGNYTVTLPSNPIDGQVITVIKRSGTGTLTFKCATAILNAPQDNVSNNSTIYVNSVGVRTLYYINSCWYLFLTSNV